MKAEEAVRFIAWRIDNGWYYKPWHLGYNNAIDWTGHPGEALPEVVQ
ncbi:hypothetical protein JRC04_04595 [Mycolicibacterium sp. S2-37]|nr:hypothetical protein [Mycolicibacterium sp. S2-37]MBO0676737.1 hypothetical protein [Mycolicibacterium sp. S2-37]